MSETATQSKVRRGRAGRHLIAEFVRGNNRIARNRIGDVCVEGGYLVRSAWGPYQNGAGYIAVEGDYVVLTQVSLDILADRIERGLPLDGDWFHVLVDAEDAEAA